MSLLGSSQLASPDPEKADSAAASARALVNAIKLDLKPRDIITRESIENAVYRASPLPDPPDPALFQRNFAFRFKPDE